MKVLIIGGSSGMGLGIAKALYKLNHEVLIASRSTEKLARAKKEIGDIKTFSLDLTQEKEVESFFSSLKSLDHLIITAAGFSVGRVTETPTENMKDFFNSKFWGQYVAAKYASPILNDSGSITFFSGAAGKKPRDSFAVGSAINAAIEAFTKALALELAPIRVNAISPGMIETPIWDEISEGERETIFQKKIKELPVQRIGTPDDIAKGAVFLIECEFITATVLRIDGGELLV